MPTRQNAVRFAVPVAALAFALSACGGGNDSGGSASSSPSHPSEGSVSSPSSAANRDLGVGESATGTVKEGDTTVTYEVTAEKVDVGTESEAQQVVADKDDAKGMVLAVAHVKFTHRAGATVTDTFNASDGTTIWADGKRGALLLFATEDGPGCDDPYDIDSWKTGESHTLCESYLIPANSKTVEVHWAGEDSDPFIWRFANK